MTPPPLLQWTKSTCKEWGNKSWFWTAFGQGRITYGVQTVDRKTFTVWIGEGAADAVKIWTFDEENSGKYMCQKHNDYIHGAIHSAISEDRLKRAIVIDPYLAEMPIIIQRNRELSWEVHQLKIKLNKINHLSSGLNSGTVT